MTAEEGGARTQSRAAGPPSCPLCHLPPQEDAGEFGSGSVGGLSCHQEVPQA